MLFVWSQISWSLVVERKMVFCFLFLFLIFILKGDKKVGHISFFLEQRLFFFLFLKTKIMFLSNLTINWAHTYIKESLLCEFIYSYFQFRKLLSYLIIFSSFLCFKILIHIYTMSINSIAPRNLYYPLCFFFFFFT